MLKLGREMNARSLSVTVSSASPLAGVSTAAHNREWWRGASVRTGTDWSGVVAAALELIAAAAIVEQLHPETITPWDAPSWREAATKYHHDRSGYLGLEIEPKRL